MAYLNGVFFSKELSRPVHYTAVLCNDNASGTDGNPCYDRPVKNIYLLHGYSGCERIGSQMHRSVTLLTATTLISLCRTATTASI